MTGPADLRQPMSDPAHEALRLALVDAVDGLAAVAQRVEGAMVLLLSTTDFAQSTLSTAIGAHRTLSEVEQRLGALEVGGAALQQAVAGLTERVAALEDGSSAA